MTKDKPRTSSWFTEDVDRKDRALVLKVVSKFGNELEFADATLRADREIVLAAISADGQSFRYANKALRKDRDFVLQVARRSPRSILHADPIFRKDRGIILEAAASEPEWVHRFADKTLQYDRALEAMVLASQVGIEVVFESGEIRNLEEIVSEGVKKFGSSALRFMLPFPKPISREHWQLIVRASFTDVLEREIYRECHGPFTGRQKLSLDIVLLIDLSDSMRPCLDAIRNQIGSLLSGLDHYSHDIEYSEWKSSIVPLITSWRVKICDYRDLGEADIDWWRESPFLDSASSITTYLESVETCGSQNAPRSPRDRFYAIATVFRAPEGAAPDNFSWNVTLKDGQINHQIVLAFSDSARPSEATDSELGDQNINIVSDDLRDAGLQISLLVPEHDCFMVTATNAWREYECL